VSNPTFPFTKLTCVYRFWTLLLHAMVSRLSSEEGE